MAGQVEGTPGELYMLEQKKRAEQLERSGYTTLKQILDYDKTMLRLRTYKKTGNP